MFEGCHRKSKSPESSDQAVIIKRILQHQHPTVNIHHLALDLVQSYLAGAAHAGRANLEKG